MNIRRALSPGTQRRDFNGLRAESDGPSHSIDPRLAVSNITSLELLAQAAIAVQRTSTLVMSAVAALATLLPARRAMRVYPMEALRSE